MARPLPMPPKFWALPPEFSCPPFLRPAKVARIASYGATIVQEGANYQEAVGLCQDYVRESGAMNIHAYDMETTLAGQGTLGRELEEQAPGSG